MAENNNTIVLVPDDEISDTDQDSSLGVNYGSSSTQSISSSILQFRKENGRTYHAYKDGKYYLPNDESENERLDLQHHLFLLTYNNKLGLAPPNNEKSKVKRVLDVGTGTGIWAIDYADEHPETEVIGIDLSPIQPDFSPPNARFVIDDIDEEWTYSESFDYIHSRMMNSCIQDYEAYFRNAFNNLHPGGYIEVQEIEAPVKSDDGTLKQDLELYTWCNLLIEATEKMGRPLLTFDHIKNAMEKVGFVDIRDSRFKWPLNRWPKDQKYKELGAWANENTLAGLEALTLAPFTRAHGWTKEEVEIFLVQVRKDVNNPKVHAYWPICSIYGRKPDA